MTSTHISRIEDALSRFSGGDLSAVDDLVAAAYVNHQPAEDEPSATEVVRRFAAAWKAAAPDLHAWLETAAQDADGSVDGELVLEGTWTGELWGAPPSGEHYRFGLPLRVQPLGDRYAFEVGLDTPGALAILRELGLVNPPDQMHLPGKVPVEIDDFLLKLLFTGQAADKACTHLADVRVVRTDVDACDDCPPDAIWPALRMCLACGHVGCCDTSVEKHAKAHWESTGHALIRSIRLDEGWIWCYEDNALFEKRVLERVAARLGGAA